MKNKSYTVGSKGFNDFIEAQKYARTASISRPGELIGKRAMIYMGNAYDGRYIERWQEGICLRNTSNGTALGQWKKSTPLTREQAEKKLNAS